MPNDPIVAVSGVSGGSYRRAAPGRRAAADRRVTDDARDPIHPTPPLAEGCPRALRREPRHGLPRGRHPGRGQDDLRARGRAPGARTPGCHVPARRRPDGPPQRPVGSGGRRARPVPRGALGAGRREPRPGRARPRDHLPAGRGAGAGPRAARARCICRARRGAPRRRRAGLGAALRRAFSPATRRLALSGMPFRSDTAAIPFVAYVGGEARPDFEFGYGDALAQRCVVRPISFPRTNGAMEWQAPDGSVHGATFDDPLGHLRANQRLRTALSAKGQWLPEVLARAHGRLCGLRRRHGEAGGLVIASDQAHARSRDTARAQPRRRRRGRDLRRPARLQAHRPLSREQGAVARRGPHGLRGRRPAPAARRGVRGDDHDRALLPPGRPPLRPFHARARLPARLPLHPRRRAPAPHRGGGRRAPSPHPACPARAAARPRVRGRRVRARRGGRAALVVRRRLGGRDRRERPRRGGRARRRRSG